MLQMLLEQLSHDVTNLGPCPPAGLIVETCRRTRPDLLVLSTTNGHGCLEAPDLIRRVRADPALGSVHVAVGGKLGCDGVEAPLLASLREAGADATFDGGEGLAPFVEFVQTLAMALEGRGATVAVG